MRNNEHLKTFVTVANQKSFLEAARILYLSQPIITSQIKALESALDKTLFIRTRKYVKLTPSAKVLYHYAVKILDLQIKPKKEIDKTPEVLHGDLMVASSLTIGENVLPSLLYDFKLKYPKVDLYTEIINSQRIVNMIKNDELEVGLIEADIEDSESELDKNAVMSDYVR